MKQYSEIFLSENLLKSLKKERLFEQKQTIFSFQDILIIGNWYEYFSEKEDLNKRKNFSLYYFELLKKQYLSKREEI